MEKFNVGININFLFNILNKKLNTMNWEDYCVGMAIALLIFLFFVFLVIFAPKSQNFFKKIEPQLDDLSKNKELMRDTFVRLNIKLNDDNLAEEYADHYKSIITKKLEWRPWLDEYTTGTVEYLPIYMFSKIDEQNHSIFNKLFGQISHIDDIKSVFFLKINTNSSLTKQKGWAELTNNTLRFIYCFNSFCYNEDECGIWVNGEAKKLFKDYNYIYDASKEHSIYNNTFDDVIFLIVDFDRPKEIAMGYSDYYLFKKD
jgi:hypothetical protein